MMNRVCNYSRQTCSYTVRIYKTVNETIGIAANQESYFQKPYDPIDDDEGYEYPDPILENEDMKQKGDFTKVVDDYYEMMITMR